MRKALACVFCLLAALAAWPAGARPLFTITAVNAQEGNAVVFTITKNAAALSYSKIAFRTLDGTAVNGTDYSGTQLSLTFGNTELTKRIQVSTIQNGLADGSRTLKGQSANLRNADIASGGVATSSYPNTLTDSELAERLAASGRGQVVANGR